MLFAIGDVHGHYGKLYRLLDHCRAMARANRQDAKFILLGDLVDRGPRSDAVVDLLVQQPSLRSLRGNHEDMLLAAVSDSQALALWLANGGDATLASYGVSHPGDLPATHLQRLAELPLYIDDGLRLFVHAGIDPLNPDQRRAEVLLWTRRHPDDAAQLPRFVVHGHTPTRDRKPDLRPNRLNLDTGAGWGYGVTAAAFTNERARPVCFISHDGALTPVD